MSQSTPTKSHHASHLRVNVEPDYEAMSRRAAEFIAEQVRRNPGMLLCTATGRSPTGTYKILAEMGREEPAVFEQLRVLKLDEWGGLGPDDPGSCERYLREHLIGPLGIDEQRYLTFRGDVPDPEAECRKMADLVDKHGPIDLCVLGLGMNGHVGLNEPADALKPRAYLSRLSKDSTTHPMLRSAGSAPLHGLTLGMADILRARKILLLVNGPHKREPLRRLLSGNVTTHLPASFLWLHADVTCFCDEDALPDDDRAVNGSRGYTLRRA